MHLHNDIELENKNLAEIIHQSPNGVLITDTAYQLVFINQSAEKMLDIDGHDFKKLNLHEIMPQIEDISETGLNIKHNKKGFHMKRFVMADKNSNFIVFLMHDLSDALKLESELQNSKRVIKELNAILEGSFDGFLVADADGNVLMVNSSYERITGIKKEELLGNNMRDMLNPVYMKESGVLLAIEKKTAVSLQHTTKHGRHIIVTGTPIFNDEEEITMIVLNVRDISEINELQLELIKAKELGEMYYQQLMDSMENDKDATGLVSASEQMKNIINLVDRVSNFNTTVMILGESGVGKEEVAKLIHKRDVVRKGLFVTVNCGAIPENLLESELFGYVKGAFTGASEEGKEGLFEMADKGTLFLDEIGEMPLSLQVKLLRVLETREVTRVGSTKPIPIDVRILVATNRDLEEEVAKKTFREDLYYRLNIIEIKIPPLRERTDDIPPLIMTFIAKYNIQYNQNKKITYDVIKEMMDYSWPGNIRELKNTIERMMIISPNEHLQITDLPWFQSGDNPELREISSKKSLPQLIESYEKKLLKEAINKYSSTRKVAKALKIDQATVVRKMKKYEIPGNKN